MERSLPARFAERGPIALLALAFGAGAFFFGFFAITVWGPLGLVCLAVLLGLLLARPSLPTGPALLALAGLFGLAIWALVSTRWAEAPDLALVDADLWLVYAVALSALLLLLEGRSVEVLALAAACLPIVAMVVYLLAAMLGGDGGHLFLGNRLNEPVNYVNGLAGFLLVAFWPAIALAERSPSKWLSGAGMTMAISVLSLAVMTQSRGALLALVVSTVALIVFVPGRIVRCWALIAAALGLAVCLPALSDVVRTLPVGAGAPDEGDLQSAAAITVVASIVAGVIWAVARHSAILEGVRAGIGRRGSTGALIAIGLVGLIAVSYPPGERIDQVRDQYDAFTELRPVDSGDRLSSGGGNRYDYWRVAWNQFEDHPLDGVGGGNYTRTYFLERRTTEDIRQAHSIELQVLGELGLIGALALAAFLGGVLWALLAASRAARDDRSIALTLAAGGIFLVWLAQTSVDWLHMLPGLTGIALVAAAILLRGRMRALEPSARGRTLGVRVGAACLTAAAAVAISVPMLAEHYRKEGVDELRDSPTEALKSARSSLRLQDDALPAYYLESAALARLGRYDEARAALLEATRREQHNFVPWALLGDLATRRGDRQAALGYYRRAQALNPLDPSLRALAGGPA